MPLNQNQNILLFCPQCNEDTKITIKYLQNSPIVHCVSGQHDITKQANDVIKKLKEADIFLENDHKKIQGVL